MVTKADVMKHTLSIMGIEGDEVYNFLVQQGLGSTRQLCNCKDETLKGLCNLLGSPLRQGMVDSFILYRSWYMHMASKMGTSFTLDEQVDNFTEEEWDAWCNEYITLSLSPGPLTPAGKSSGGFGLGGSPGMGAGSPAAGSTLGLKVSLKDFPTTNGRAADWPRFKRKFLAAAGVNGMDKLLDKNYAILVIFNLEP